MRCHAWERPVLRFPQAPGDRQSYFGAAIVSSEVSVISGERMRTRRGCVPVCVTAMALCLIHAGFQADEAVAQRTPRLPSATSAVHRVNSADL
jgi:hypothetical protein